MHQTSIPPHEKVVYDKQTQTLHSGTEKESKFALHLGYIVEYSYSMSINYYLKAHRVGDICTFKVICL